MALEIVLRSLMILVGLGSMAFGATATYFAYRYNRCVIETVINVVLGITILIGGGILIVMMVVGVI